MSGEKDPRQRILEMLDNLIGETSLTAISQYTDNIKKLIKELPKTTYKAKGKFDCQSAVFYLDNVVENLNKMTEDLGRTAKKLGNDGQTDRSLNCVHLTHSFIDLRDKVTGIRNYINRRL